MIYLTASNAVLAFLKSQPTRAEFLRRAGVRRNTYAAELMFNIYDTVFIYSKNLREEYLKYYKIEYPKFSVFAEAFTHVPDSAMSKMDFYFEAYEFIVSFTIPTYLQEELGAKTLGYLLNTKFAK